jgi:hypothetical protein
MLTSSSKSPQPLGPDRDERLMSGSATRPLASVSR